MARDRAGRFLHQPLCIGLAQLLDLGQRVAGRNIAIDQVMRRGLVGHDVGDHAGREDLGIEIRGIAAEPDRQRLLRALRGANRGQRLVERGDLAVEIAVGQAAFDPLLVHLDAQDHCFGEAAGQRLRAAHAAKTGGEDEAPMQVAVEITLGDAHEDLIGALDDTLRADILPVAGGQPAPTDQALLIQFIEIFRLGPLADHVAIGHDD